MRCDDILIALEDSDDYISLRSLGLFCTRWNFPPALPKLATTPVSGGDGVFDQSEVAHGDISYGNVTGTLRIVAFADTSEAEFTAQGRYDHRTFLQTFHGKRVKIRPSFDTDHYRVGRMWVSDDGQQASLRRFTVTVDADPFAYNVAETEVSFESINGEIPAMAREESIRGLYCDDLNSTAKEVKEFSFRRSYLEDAPFSTITVSFEIEPNKIYLLDYKLKDGNYYEQIEPELYLDASRTKKVDKLFFSGDSTKLYMYFWCNCWYTSHTTYYGIEDIMLAEPMPHIISNNGRKVLIPELSSDVDCIVSCGDNRIELKAGEPVTAWDFPLFHGENVCTSISPEVGTVTVRFREGFV